MNTRKLHDVILDHSTEPIEKLILAMEQELAALQPFKHSEENSQKACGINLTDKKLDFVEKLKAASKRSEEAEILEGYFTKRELVFMFLQLQSELQSLATVKKLMERFRGFLEG